MSEKMEKLDINDNRGGEKWTDGLQNNIVSSVTIGFYDELCNTYTETVFDNYMDVFRKTYKHCDK